MQVRPALAATHGTTAEDGHRDHGRGVPSEFHDLVEGTSDERRALVVVRRPARASWVRSGRCPRREPDPAFVPTLRERLMEEAADRARRGRRPSRPTPTRGSGCARPRRGPAANRRLAAVVSGVILVGATATMAVAAQTALPGRRGSTRSSAAIESAHAQLTFDRAARGRVLLDNASTRLDEVAELSRTGGSADAASARPSTPSPRRRSTAPTC